MRKRIEPDLDATATPWRPLAQTAGIRPKYAALVALNRSAGNRVANLAIQRVTEQDQVKWSKGKKFATASDNQPGLLGARTPDLLPSLAGTMWDRSTTEFRFRPSGQPVLPAYELEWEHSGQAVEIPQDCITTAELVAAWLSNTALDRITEVEVNRAPVVAAATDAARPGPKDIIFHMHCPGVGKEGGDFHAAAVIARDGKDFVTMEADASDDLVELGAPIFDMYAGAPAFKNQHRRRGSEAGSLEKTYVISIGLRKDPRSNPTLLASIRKALESKTFYAESVEETVQQIQESILRATGAPSAKRSRKKI